MIITAKLVHHTCRIQTILVSILFPDCYYTSDNCYVSILKKIFYVGKCELSEIHR